MNKFLLSIGAFLCILPLSGSIKADEVPTITMAIASLDSDSSDDSSVAQELDRYVYETLGFHVQIEYLDYLNYSKEISNFYLKGLMPDLYLVTSESDYTILLGDHKLHPLNDLICEYGEGLLELCSDQALTSHTESDGECYAVPCIHSRNWTIGFEYRVSIAEEYGLDMDSVHSIDDLSAVFASLKEQNPNIAPLGWNVYRAWDTLDDSLGVLMNMGNSDTIENLYETEEYKHLCLLLADWRQNGYLLDSDYVQQDFTSYVGLSDVFGKLSDYTPDMEWTDAIEGKEEFRCIPLSESVIMSNAYNRDLWVISSETKYPEAAMQLLNLLYTDPTLPNLLAYGIPQQDYEFTDSANEIHLYAMDCEDSGKPITIRNYLVGNQYACYRLDGFPEDIWDQVVEFEQNASISEGYGFSFDNQSVAEQISACQNVVSLYEPLLLYGTEDAPEVLSQFQDALRDAGIDDIIAEKQRQFDAWKAEERR